MKGGVTLPWNPVWDHATTPTGTRPYRHLVVAVATPPAVRFTFPLETPTTTRQTQRRSLQQPTRSMRHHPERHSPLAEARGKYSLPSKFLSQPVSRGSPEHTQMIEPYSRRPRPGHCTTQIGREALRRYLPQCPRTKLLLHPKVMLRQRPRLKLHRRCKLVAPQLDLPCRRKHNLDLPEPRRSAHINLQLQ